MRLPTLISRCRPAPAAACLAVLATSVVLLAGQTPAVAAPNGVPLGQADSFAVLAASKVANTGPSVVTGSVGVTPALAVTGFDGPPGGTVVGGSIYRGSAAAGAKADASTAYDKAAQFSPSKPGLQGTELGKLRLFAGVYRFGTLGITGTLTLDAQGNPDAVFIFQAGSTLTTASASRVNLVNGANPCNVFWQIGSSATLGTYSHFVGTILAKASITVTTGTAIVGRVFAQTAAVTLDTNRITRPTCGTTGGGGSGSGGSSSAPGGGASSTPAGGGTATVGGGGAPGGGGPGGGPIGGRPVGGGSSTPAAGAPGVPFRTTGTGTSTSTSTSNGPSPRASTPGTSTSSPPNVSTSPATPSAGQPPHLARTGSNTAALVQGAALAILAGGLVLFVTRRRPARDKHRH